MTQPRLESDYGRNQARMRCWISRHYWLVITVLILAVLLLTVGPTLAQPPVPHGVIEGDDCLSCHEAGVADAPRLSRDHMGRRNEDCAICHEASGAFADDMPHTVAGREDCLACHSVGIGTILARSHLDRTNDQCELCHLPPPVEEEPTPTPTVREPTAIPTATKPAPTPTPHATPEAASTSAGTETCAACHQRTVADAGHAAFTSQPLDQQEAGATLFAQQCATCHGEDGTTPVGEEGAIINSEAYLSTHDDADVLTDIGINPHGETPGFVEDYGGPLSWRGVLALAAFMRSWEGTATLPAQTPVAEGPAHPTETHPVPLIGAHQGVTCETCHVEGQQAPEYICANCHQPTENHFEQSCDTCHTPEGWIESAASLVAQSPQIPHPLEGQNDCLLCHDPAGQIKPAPADHEGRVKEQCLICHSVP